MEAEDAHRRAAVELLRERRREGQSTQQIADSLGLCRRTLTDWAQRGDWKPKARGRPLARGTREQRNRVIAFLRKEGDHVGVPTLQAEFPELGRRELRELARRFKAFRAAEREAGAKLVWHAPGSVWATDFTETARRIDGDKPYLLVVRDLASHMVLLALPTKCQTAEVVIAALSTLLAKHGAPLVLKSDNGSAYIAERTRETLALAGVKHLYSPARTPSYNGSCEAGNTGLEARIAHQAYAAGRPWCWRSEDVRRAVEQGNRLLRPWGPTGRTPAEVWTARDRAMQEHVDFAREYLEALAANDYETNVERTRREQAKVDRVVIPVALEACGLLTIKRRCDSSS